MVKIRAFQPSPREEQTTTLSLLATEHVREGDERRAQRLDRILEPKLPKQRRASAAHSTAWIDNNPPDHIGRSDPITAASKKGEGDG